MPEATYTQVRNGVKSGTAHLADSDGKLLCGTSGQTVKTSPKNVEAFVTCSKCRDLVGWHRAPGSLRSRTSRGLDSSAWGANKGR